MADKCASVLCLTEHWMAEDELQSVRLQGYQLGSYSCRQQTTGGGSAIFLEDGLTFCDLIVGDKLNVVNREKCIEYCCVHCERLDCYILCIYRSPSGSFGTFLESLEQILTNLPSTAKLIIAGDFNVHFNTTDPSAMRVCDLLSSFGLGQTVREPTRGLACLDNIFANTLIEVCTHGTVDVGVSDHWGQLVRFKFYEYYNFLDKKTFRPITQHGQNSFYKLLSEETWNFVSDDKLDPSHKFEVFIQTLENAYTSSFPEKTYKYRSEQPTIIPWFNNNIKIMRDRLAFLRELKNQYNCISTQEYNQYRAAYQRQIKKAKIESNDNHIKYSNNRAKAMWNIINKNKTRGGGVPDTELSPDDFNKFFCSIAEDIIKTIPKTKTNPASHIKPNLGNSDALLFRAVTFNEVRDIIQSLKNKNSRDIYGLNVKLIKSIKNLIVIPLTKLINICLQGSVFPDVLKVALVTPIFKKGDVNKAENYRPISLLPIISKIFEKCMALRVVDYFESNNLFTEHQFGFRKGRNTVMAILDLVSQITEAFDRKHYTAALFCDLSKAFDCVDHNILFQKLYAYNFHKKSVDIIKSYLANRRQLVKLGGVTSAEGVVNVGVPQGSILGPIIFLMYINDLPASNNNVRFTLFADDTTIAQSENTQELAVSGSRDAQERAELWFCTNGLLLNENKTQQMLFAVRPLNEWGGITEAKFLGVTLDTKLQWGPHTTKISGKVSKGIYVLRGLSKNVSHEILRTAYFALVQTHLSYGILAWGHSSGARGLFALQRRAVRVLDGLDYRDDCREAFVHCQLLTLPCLYIFENLLYIKKSNIYLTHDNVHEYDTRNKTNFVPLYWRLGRCRDGPGYWAIKLFNVLPAEIKRLPVDKFYAKVKSILINNCFYSLDEFIEFRF